jgi:hypothetical protein
MTATIGIAFVEAFDTKGRRRHSMPKQIRARKRNPRAAGADKSRERVDAAPNMIGQHKSKAELDAEARAEALLKKAQSKFYSLE